MIHIQSSWKSEDGRKIFYQSWKPEEPLKGAICLVHGLGEHSDRYSHVAEHLNQAGYALFAFDLYGHGQSGGKRGHAPSMEIFLQDIDRILLEAKNQYPGKPCFLYGHSLGGILVLYYVLQQKPILNGVISTSPALRSSLENQKTKLIIARIFSKIFPALSLPSGLDPNQISRDPQVVNNYMKDPLVHDQATLATACNVFDAILWTFDHAEEFDIPLLLIHGTADNIAYPRGSQEFANLVHCQCTYKTFDGLRHETHNEPEKDEVINYIVSWLNEHI